MAKQKRSNSTRSAYDRASRFARSNRRTLGMLGAGLAAAAAVFFGRRYRDQQARWTEDEVVGASAI